MKNINSVICLSFLIVFLFVFSFPSICFSEVKTNQINSKKEKEINEFMTKFVEETKEFQRQDLEYSNIFESIPQTEEELKDRLLKVEEYKNFTKIKDNNFNRLIKFFRNTNSKYKKNKFVNKRIDKLEKISKDVSKVTNKTLDMYNKLLITRDKKYSTFIQQEYNKQQTLKIEVSKLIDNILKSL